MLRLASLTAALTVLLGGALWAQGNDRLLPAQTEVSIKKQAGDTELYTLRGRDTRASEVLTMMVEAGDVTVIVDSLAERLLRTTIVTVDLYERRAGYVIDLIAAAAGLDVIREVEVFRLMGPPMPGSGEVREAQRLAAEKFYNIALLSQRDEKVTAIALRGLAELHRRSGDFDSAFGVYETLLSRFPESKPARDTEVLLADCYREIGDGVRATQLLRSFLNKQLVPHLRDAALRRLLGLLIETGSFRDIADLREGFLKLPAISPKSLSRLSDAAMAMVEAGDPEATVLLLSDIWRRDPEAHAVLGPVLALGLMTQKVADPEAASKVLALSSRFIEGGQFSATAYMAWAEVARKTGRTAETLIFATTAMRSKDAGPAVLLQANLLLGELYRSLGLTLRARRHFYEAEQLSSVEEAAALALESARMALEEEEPERARLLYQATSDVELVRRESELGIARALLAAGDAERARTALTLMSEEQFPERYRKPLTMLAVDCLEALGEFESARKVLNGDLAALRRDQKP
ncbi:MAG: tetratricopeptide repeat protein [Planctomycetota bacterium]